MKFRRFRSAPIAQDLLITIHSKSFFFGDWKDIDPLMFLSLTQGTKRGTHEGPLAVPILLAAHLISSLSIPTAELHM